MLVLHEFAIVYQHVDTKTIAVRFAESCFV